MSLQADRQVLQAVVATFLGNGGKAFDGPSAVTELLSLHDYISAASTLNELIHAGYIDAPPEEQSGGDSFVTYADYDLRWVRPTIKGIFEAIT